MKLRFDLRNTDGFHGILKAILFFILINSWATFVLGFHNERAGFTVNVFLAHPFIRIMTDVTRVHYSLLDLL